MSKLIYYSSRFAVMDVDFEKLKKSKPNCSIHTNRILSFDPEFTSLPFEDFLEINPKRTFCIECWWEINMPHINFGEDRGVE